MNLPYFGPKMRGKVKQKQQPSQHQICRQNIKHQKFSWEHHSWCHVKISEVGFNDPELLVQSRGSRSRNALLFRHKG